MLAAGIAALLVVAAVERRSLAFTLGVQPVASAVVLESDTQTCQAGIDVPAAFSAVRLHAESARGGAAVRVAIVDAETQDRLAAGRLQRVHREGTALTVEVGHVAAGRRVDVCVTNVGRRRLDLLGNIDIAAPETTMQPLTPAPHDLALDFVREEPASLLSLAPAVFERAALWRPGWVGPWLFWALTVLVVVAVPLLLLRALATATPCRRGGFSRRSG